MYPSGRCVAESIAKLKIAVQWYESGSDDSFKGRNQSQDAVKPHFAGALIRGFECREWPGIRTPEFEKLVLWKLSPSSWRITSMLWSLEFSAALLGRGNQGLEERSAC
jgi:hypothetical protein